MSGVDYFFPQGVDRSHPCSHLTSPNCCVCHCAQVQRLRQALQESQADRDTARLDKELLAQRLQGLEQEAENKKRSQDDRTRQLKGLEVRTLGGGLWWVGGKRSGSWHRWDFCEPRNQDTPSFFLHGGTKTGSPLLLGFV